MDYVKHKKVLIKAGDRNKYLTTLLQPPVVGPTEVKTLLHELWPVVEPFVWVNESDITLESEVAWLAEHCPN